MILEVKNVTSSYVQLVKSGIYTKNVILTNSESDLILDWMIACSNLPDSCSVNIYNSRKIKKKKLKDGEDPVYKMGVFLILDEPVYCFYFDEQGIIFEPLSEEYDLSFKEWTDIYMYDLRTQASIGHLLYALKPYGDYKK